MYIHVMCVCACHEISVHIYNMFVSANDNHKQEPLEKTEGWKFQSASSSTPPQPKVSTISAVISEHHTKW